MFPYSKLSPSKVCSFYGRTLKDPGRRWDEFGKCLHKATSWLLITVKYMLYSPGIKGTTPILQPELICEEVNLLLVPVLSVPCDGGVLFIWRAPLQAIFFEYVPQSLKLLQESKAATRRLHRELETLKCCLQLGEAPSSHAPWISLEVHVSLLESLSNATASPYKSLLLCSQTLDTQDSKPAQTRNPPHPKP